MPDGSIKMEDGNVDDIYLKIYFRSSYDTEVLEIHTKSIKKSIAV